MSVSLAYAEAGRPAWRRQAGALLFPVLLVVTCLCAVVPFSPRMPVGGLDPSWALGMNQVMAQGLILGRDVAFTFGPYASVATRFYHPATDGLMMWGAVFLAVPLCLGILLHFRDSHWFIKATLLLWLAARPAGLDVLATFHALLAGFYFLGHEVEERRRNLRTVACLLVLLVPFGLAPLIKGNAIPIFGAVAALSCLHLLTRRNWAAATLVAGAPLAFLAVFWAAAGQNLADLPVYFTAMVPIIGGYTEAMNIRGPMIEPALTLGALFLFAYTIYFSEEKHVSKKIFQILVASLSVFIMWKEGFVRQDGHAIQTGSFMISAGLLLVNLPEARRLVKARVLIALFCVSVLVVTFYHHRPMTLGDMADNVRETYGNAWEGMVNRLDHSDPLRRAFAEAMAEIARTDGLPVLAGTSDIYSYDLASLIASGNRWNPRLVFQSYSAYGPALAALNNAHLVGAGAPDNLFFQVQPIDGRYPSLEDGQSWPTILKNYRPAGFSARHLILKRHDISPVALPEPILRSRHVFGERVEVPREHGPLFVRLQFRKSLLGVVAELLFKSSTLQISVTLDDGTTSDYRLASGMAEAGFLLSPLVRSAADFAHLYADPAALDAQRVRSFTIVPPRFASAWADHYDIAFVPLP